jgi:hypothetical protein
MRSFALLKNPREQFSLQRGDEKGAKRKAVRLRSQRRMKKFVRIRLRKTTHPRTTVI